MLKNYRAAMKKAGFKNDTELAELLGMSRPSLSNKINEKVEFKAAEAKKSLEIFRSRGLDVSFDYLFLLGSPK